jgi:Sec7-like guanine-nucleotide exchange factor
MINLIKQIKEIDSKSPDFESLLNELFERELSKSLNDFKILLQDYCVLNADKLASNTPYIAPYNKYDKFISSYNAIVDFLKSEASKIENWKLTTISMVKDDCCLWKLKFKNFAVDSGDDDGVVLAGIVFVNNQGAIKHVTMHIDL